MNETALAQSRIRDCLSLYKEIGITGYTLELHPDFPGCWLLHLQADELTEEVFTSLKAIWPICSKEWPSLAGIKLNNLKPLNREAFRTLCW